MRRLLLALSFAAVLGACPKNDPMPPGDAPPSTPPQASECISAADCRTFSDYCTGCDCRPLTKAAKDPTCESPGVRCVADPCMNRKADCVSGTCTIVDAKAPAM